MFTFRDDIEPTYEHLVGFCVKRGAPSFPSELSVEALNDNAAFRISFLFVKALYFEYIELQ